MIAETAVGDSRLQPINMGESRTELLAWLNDLLQINYTKVEQAGTVLGAVVFHDELFDIKHKALLTAKLWTQSLVRIQERSIREDLSKNTIGDVHMSKVKFDTKHEYEYIANYKVLQHTFDKHKIDKVVPVDRLLKCKFQDNLEFMQWVKRFWDQNFPGGSYDAVQRRKGGGPKTATRSGVSSAARKPATGTTRTASRATSGRLSSSNASSSALDNHSASMIIDLNKQISELKMTVDGLEKERDFYFGKLRDIEILVQDQLEGVEPEHEDEHAEVPVLKEIQAILYSTEDGFEVPPEEELAQDEYEDETF
ncbi:hypothetical protein EC973_004611 [Apophysomyces ossiformis]|uniref:EB1 C-terminal domain-containing protein n=1 Tax=Apophysomyces ossiformis TaxID=679940 RepID=A0A8H7BSB7_9FUNG|nr:hypothetical protein EC973_004611 [Apophysomyces ossiformis]